MDDLQEPHPLEVEEEGPTDVAAVEQAATQELPLLAELLDDTEHFRDYHNTDGKRRIQCLWCEQNYSHVTKVLYHINKIRNQGVATCPANLPGNHKKRYWELYERKMGDKSRKNGKFILCSTLPFHIQPTFI